jgi:acetoin utilization deacetylase AcuC-like enzyme
MSESKIAISIVKSEGHALPGHPESPQRFSFFSELFDGPLSASLLNIPGTAASSESILRVHTPEYLNSLEKICRSGGGFLDYGDTYASRVSYQAALNASGGTLGVLDWVVKGEARPGFALVRPPGHHATKDKAMGFCLLNNIAIAAREAQEKGLKRVMIVDFDVHHGNGTQAVFDRDSSVLYISTHQEGIYPGSGWWTDAGSGSGEGYTVNIPLPARAGDANFEEIFEEIIFPMANRFTPDILLVSAGYDAHWTDPLASLSLSTSGYYSIGSWLMEIANLYSHGRLLFVLEGGYDPKTLADNVEATLCAIAGIADPGQGNPSPSGPEPEISDLISSLRSLHHLG